MNKMKGKCFLCENIKELSCVREDIFICSDCNEMKEDINFRKLTTPNFEKIFEVQTTDSDITKVRAFEPELRSGDIVLPVEFTKTDGETLTLGFTLDKTHLRDILDSLDYPDTIGQ